MSRRHGVGKRLGALAAELGFVDVQMTERGHLRFIHPSGRIVVAGTRTRGERNAAAAALKRYARLWQQQSPASPSPSSPGA
jgi:hypothetical protein